MKGNLIVITQQEELFNYYENFDIKINRFLSQCGVEIDKTTIFKDLKSSLNKITNELTTFSIIVLNSSSNLDELFLCLNSYYQTNKFKTNFGYLWDNGNSKCFIVFMDNMQQNFLNDNELKTFFYTEHTNIKIKTFGLDSIYVKEIISKIEKPNYVVLSIFSAFLDCEINIFVPDNAVDTTQFNTYIRTLYETFNDYIYSDNDDSLKNKLIELLQLRKIKISICDKLTKGELANQLLDNKYNYEDFLSENIIIHNQNEYVEDLGISSNFISSHSPDSIEFAYEIGATMLEKQNCDIALSLSGSLNKPFIAVGDRTAIHVYKFNFDHNEKVVKEILINSAFFKLLKKIKQNDLYFFKNSV